MPKKCKHPKPRPKPKSRFVVNLTMIRLMNLIGYNGRSGVIHYS